MKYKILETTAPDIPVEDVILNEKIHDKIEQTDIYQWYRHHELETQEFARK